MLYFSAARVCNTALPKTDYAIFASPLSGEVQRDGITIDLQIYRGEENETWVVGTVDSENPSHLWDNQLSTDQDAMDELSRTLQTDAMKQFNPHQRSKFS